MVPEPQGGDPAAALVENAASLKRKLVYLEPRTTTRLVNVRLIDGTGAAPREGLTVEIRGDRITRIAHETADEPVDTVIDARGCTVIPGMIDCHTHFSGNHERTPFERYMPSVSVAYRGIVALNDLLSTLAAGFTTVRCLGHGVAEQVYAMRRAVVDGSLAGPRILTAGWAISQTGGHGHPRFMSAELTHRFRPRSAFADGPVGCRIMVRENFGEGADCIKFYANESASSETGIRRSSANFTLEEIEAMTDEAHIHGARVAAHATIAAGVRNALLGGVDTIEHGGALGESPDLIDLMIERRVFLVPTLRIYWLMGEFGDRLGLDGSQMAARRRQSERERAYLREALDRGLQIAVGTDSDLGDFDRGGNAKELGLLVESGFTPMQALCAATKTSAQAIGLGDRLGTLEEGKVGEMVVLDCDPLADINSLTNKDHIRWILKSRDQLC